MGADESFLARWSRRKSAAATSLAQKPQPVKEASFEIGADQPVAVEPPAAADLENLPPTDSIGAGSDLRAFLAPGVPPDLARAALRRAWLADPAIRDFVGLSENSWDFTAPDGVPGFGTVTPDQVRQLLAQLTREVGREEPVPASAEATASGEPTAAPLQSHSRIRTAEGQGTDGKPEAITAQPGLQSAGENIPTQREFGRCELSPSLPPRRHGGALPQ